MKCRWEEDIWYPHCVGRFRMWHSAGPYQEVGNRGVVIPLHGSDRAISVSGHDPGWRGQGWQQMPCSSGEVPHRKAGQCAVWRAVWTRDSYGCCCHSSHNGDVAVVTGKLGKGLFKKPGQEFLREIGQNIVKSWERSYKKRDGNHLFLYCNLIIAFTTKRAMVTLVRAAFELKHLRVRHTIQIHVKVSKKIYPSADRQTYLTT